MLNDYFDAEDVMDKGLPTVQWVADQINLSPNYLSNLLKTFTGQSTQQHIHDKILELAKEQLSTTYQPISSIAYNLGFENPASFTRLFKSKTDLSPLDFRRRFN